MIPDYLKQAHDGLSAALEDEDAGNDEVRDRAIDVCQALNAFYEASKPRTQFNIAAGLELFAEEIATTIILCQMHQADFEEILGSARILAMTRGLKPQ